jgi:hypothetical protein
MNRVKSDVHGKYVSLSGNIYRPKATQPSDLAVSTIVVTKRPAPRIARVITLITAHRQELWFHCGDANQEVNGKRRGHEGCYLEE